MTVFGTDRSNWKSPFNTASPDTVPGLDGYPVSGSPGFSSYYQWEWPMVYEWSVDLSSFGPAPIFVISANSHHSPAKTGDENDYFPDPPGNGYLSDYGDLPSAYPTLLADNGAYHYIVPNSVMLGEQLDPEPDGQPDDNAVGDDELGSEDEDGVSLVSVENGESLTFNVSVSDAGYLSAFLDYAEAGSLGSVNLISSSGPAALTAGPVSDLFIPQAGTYSLTVEAPFITVTYVAARFRITNDSGEGGANPNGMATSGEVEDYIWDVSNALSSQIDIEAFATSKGSVKIKVYTVNENGNNNIEIYAMIEDEWVMVAMVPSEKVHGDGSHVYTVKASGLIAGVSYQFRIIDESGHTFETAAPITVSRYRLKATKTSLNSSSFMSTFNTEPYEWYELWVSRFIGSKADWSPEYVQVVHPAFPDGVSGYMLQFQGAPEGTTTLRVPRNCQKAFFKLIKVEPTSEIP